MVSRSYAPRCASRTTRVRSVGGIVSVTIHLIEKRGAKPAGWWPLIGFVAGAKAASVRNNRKYRITGEPARIRGWRGAWENVVPIWTYRTYWKEESAVLH